MTEFNKSSENESGALQASLVMYEAILNMENYGKLLRHKKSPQGVVVEKLSKELNIKLNCFLKLSKEEQSKQFPEFEKDFIKTLHSKDQEMSQYRVNWTTIKNNVLLALTGIGALFIIGHLAYTKLKGGRALFFGQKPETTREGNRNRVEEALKKLNKPLGKETGPVSNIPMPTVTEVSVPLAVTRFLECVVQRRQLEAEDMLKNFPQLLLQTGDVTDYSARIFKNITAYEYALWAKDKHMCRMLEKYKDNEINADMLTRFDAIEDKGLTHTQYGQQINSKHFEVDKLKVAMEEYHRAILDWQYCRGEEKLVKSAWIKVGIAQRDLPVHYVHEWLRKEGFDERSAFDQSTLPDELTIFNLITMREELFFPAMQTSSGPVVTYGFIGAIGKWIPRGTEGLTTFTAEEEAQNRSSTLTGYHLGRDNGISAMRDLRALIRLDKVRTSDLVQSRKNLESAVPAPRHL